MATRPSTLRTNPAASDTTGRTPPKNLRIEFYDEDGDNDPRVERMAEAAWKIALASPIRILSNKRLSAIAVLGRKVVGAAWYSVAFPWSGDEPGQFSFDIVVAPEAQGKGVGDALVGEMLDQFRHERHAYDDLVLNVEVVNPAMERILARRGFRLRDEEDPLAARGRTMMTRPNGRPVLRPNGRPVPRPNGRRNPEPAPVAETPYSEDHYRLALAGEKRLAGANLRGADLAGADLRDANLQQVDLRDANLRGADLRGATLFYATLWHANLEGADLRGAKLTGAGFTAANLTKADLRGVDLERGALSKANFTEANLEDARLAEAGLEEANFARANLRQANLIMVRAAEANFTDADLEGALLASAEVTNTTFLRAHLRNARLLTLRRAHGIIFSNADLTRAHFDDTALIDTNLEGADLTEAELEDVVFNGCSLIDADLTNANLRGTRFNDCNMRGAVGTPAERVRDPNADLRGLDFLRLDLSGVDFTGRDIGTARFEHANLTGASFVACDMRYCNLFKANITDADFTNANLFSATLFKAVALRTRFMSARLERTDMSHAKLEHANLRGAELTRVKMPNVIANMADFSNATLHEVEATGGWFVQTVFRRARIEETDFSRAQCNYADFREAELRTVRFDEAELFDADFSGETVLEDVSVTGAAMDPATRALLVPPPTRRSAYGKMSGPILKMDKPDAPMKAAEFKKQYPREFERLKTETGGRDFLPAVKATIRTKHQSPRPWLLTKGQYTGRAQRYCGSPNNVLKFNIALDDEAFTPAQRNSLRKLAETSRRSGHPYESGDLFTIGWVRYCPDNTERTWLVEEVQSDVSVVRQQLKDEKEFPREFREVVDILAPIAERFYYDALGVIFELAAENGYEVEMLDYPAKKDMGSPRSVYTDLPREMGMQKKPKSALEGEAVSGVGAVWAYRPNPKRRRGGRK